MNRESTDQTASELRLHRVLWLIKAMRALTLHVFLILVATVLFLATGVQGLYPAATDAINLFRAVYSQYSFRGGSIGFLGFNILPSILVLFALALLIWIYRSMINAKTSSLKLLAVFWMTMSIWNLQNSLPELNFAFEHLNPLFALLAMLSVAMGTLIVPLNVTRALWSVAGSPERSSFEAELDSRLAPNIWCYLNKLLALPRTPLRTKETALAYVMAFSGSILLISAMMYLITVGGAAVKLTRLKIAGELDSKQIPLCLEHSNEFARAIPLWLILAACALKGSDLLQSAAKRLGGLSVSDILKKPNERFLLYLRPFDADDVILPKPRLPLISRFISFRPFPVHIEQELFDVADGYLPLIAVGRPRGSKQSLGGLAYRTYLEDSDWQAYVADRIRTADRIVILLKTTDGVRWEFSQVIKEGATLKTLFLFDPTMKETADWTPIEKMIAPSLRAIGGDLDLTSRPIGFFFHQNRLIQILNANWSATSYRTAFSYFLATKAGSDPLPRLQGASLNCPPAPPNTE